MKILVREKEQAIELRKKGLSYKEILKIVPVAKSSLSLWLKNTPLSINEKRLLKERINNNVSRGQLKAAAAHRANREERDHLLVQEMRALFNQYKHNPLFLIGIMLYWAEGSHRSSSFLFTNSDADMVNVMLDWIENYFHLSRQQIGVRLYLHKPFAHEHCEERWSREIGVPISRFKKTIFKPTGKLVKKRPDYKGCLRVEITNGLAARKMDFLTDIFLADYKKTSKVMDKRP